MQQTLNGGQPNQQQMAQMGRTPAGQDFIMPKVGNKSFKYNKAGKAAAKTEAKKTGKKVKRKKY